MSLTSQKSLAGGEIAPALYARTDSNKYQLGLRQLRNYLVMRSGGAQNRPGTEFIGETRNTGAAVRLIPYLATSQVNYMLEFGNLYIKPWKNGSHILESAVAVNSVSWADPVQITANAHGYSNGNEIKFSNSGLDYLGGAGTFIIANVTANTFTLKYLSGTAVNASAIVGSAPTITEVKRVYSVVSTFTTAELPDIQFAQNGDDVTLAHSAHVVANLRRTTDTSWAITNLSFGADIATPTASFNVNGGTNAWTYAVTAIDEVTSEESLGRTSTGPVSGALAAGNDFADVAGASEYRLYLNKGFGYGLVGISQTSAFPVLLAENLVPDFTEAPYFANNSPFPTYYPRVVSYSQQRLMLASTTDLTQTVWTSWTGAYTNFNRKGLTKDNQAIVFTMAGREGNEIRHMLEVGGKLIVLTNTGEWVAEGGASGIITPTEINLKQHSYNGCSKLFPLIADNTALYVQFNKSIVRDLAFQFESDGYRGNDLTTYANHLFDGHSIVDWAYQKTPNSVIWCVRADGSMVALTYIREQQIFAWHRHDTEGLFENAISFSEQLEDVVYFVVKRTIEGVSRRYIERIGTRILGDIEDAIFMDSALTYDGRNAAATTMTLTPSKTFTVTIASPGVFTSTAHGYAVGSVVYLTTTGALPTGLTAGTAYYVVSVPSADTFRVSATSGGTAINTSGSQSGVHSVATWAYTETLTCTASVATFAAADVGNAVHITGADGTVIRFTIAGYTSTTVVTGSAQMTVPVAMRSTARATWALAVDSVAGLWHLEAKDVSVLGDGFVVASPNNSAYVVRTVTDGVLTLDKPYAVIHVGLPYLSDIETLDIDEANSETMANKRMVIQAVNLQLEKTRGLWAGGKPPTDDDTDPLEGLSELKIRNEEGYESPVDLLTGKTDVLIDGGWNSNGRVFIRQVDPVPSSVLAISPEGMIPQRR